MKLVSTLSVGFHLGSEGLKTTRTTLKVQGSVVDPAAVTRTCVQSFYKSSVENLGGES